VKTQILGIAASILGAGGLLLILRALDVSAEPRGIWAGAVGYAVGDLARFIIDHRHRSRTS
jgi:hypothetical protein